MSFGYSTGDFYFLVQLLSSLRESFGSGPLGAASQYSAFAAKFELIHRQLDNLPEKDPSFLALWNTAKVQCTDFLLKYSGLVPTDTRILGNKETTWKWLCNRGSKILAKVQWPLAARKEFMALELNVLNIVNIATLSLSSGSYKENQRIHETLESLRHQVLDGIKLSNSSSVFSQTNNEKLYLRIEEVRKHAMFIMSCRNSEAISYSFDITLPVHLPYTNSEPSEFTFDEACDKLEIIVDTMQNLRMRQHGLPFPSASSTIALLEHITLIIGVALSRIGLLLPQHQKKNPQYNAEQRKLESTLKLVYRDWIQFVKEAQNLCERSREILALRTYDHSSKDLDDISEGSSVSEWSYLQKRQKISIVPNYSRLRRDSSEFSPTTGPSPSRRTSLFVSTIGADGIVGKTIKLIIADPDGVPTTIYGKSLEQCTVSAVELKIGENTKRIELQSKDKKVIFRHLIGRNQESSKETSQVVTLNYFSLYGDFRVVHGIQKPHPCGDPIYMFDSEHDSYSFQSVVLHEKILGQKVIFSAEVQRIDTQKQSCNLLILRVIQDHPGSNSILYWEAKLPEVTGGQADFVQWFQTDFKKVTKPREKHALLSFTYELKDSKTQRKSSSSKSSLPDKSKRLSKEGRSPPHSPSLPTVQPVHGSPVIDWDSKSPQSPGESNICSTSAPSDWGGFAQPTLDAKSKAKGEMQCLDIKFYTQKDRDDFIERFAWTPRSSAL